MLPRGAVLLSCVVCCFSLVKVVRAEEKEEIDQVSIVVSIMLLGSISFMMALFYLVNHKDEDIQRYSWKAVSSTISIFCAVLLFQAFNGIVEEYLIGGMVSFMRWEEEFWASKLWECVVDFCQLVFWLTVMQFVLAVTSGAVELVWKPENIEQAEILVQSWAVLFAHISGFASVNGWGSIQQNALRWSCWTSVLVVPLGLVGLFSMYKVFDIIRNKISLGDDGEVDEFEECWDKETEESENDVAGLCLSFLTVQVIRQAISGDLPNSEGQETDRIAYNHPTGEWVTLLLWAAAFVVGLLVVLRLRDWLPDPEAEEEKEGEQTEEEKKAFEEAYQEVEWTVRSLMITSNYCSMAIAWCGFYGARWAVAASGATNKDALLAVILAILLSFVCFAIIFLLDKLEDWNVFGGQSNKAIENIIDALGILIGFSWEQSFDEAVDVISNAAENLDIPRSWTRLIMSVALVTLVFPAWRAYILPTEQKLRGQTTAKGKKKKRLEDMLKKHCDHILEEEADERDMDHAHCYLKLHRRIISHRAHGKKPPHHNLRHMIVTAKGLLEVDMKEVEEAQEVAGMHERLLPHHLHDEEDDEGEGETASWREKCCIL